MSFISKVNSLYSVSLFLLIASINGTSQTWQYSISQDFEFGIRDKWGESGSYKAKFVVANPRTAFVKEITVTDDNWGTLLFPQEFKHTRGNFNPDTLTAFNWYIEVRNKRVATGSIVYNPSPNTVLQLSKFEPQQIATEVEVWGEIMDAYSWIDKNGVNIFMRSSLAVKNGKYLYTYHYVEKEEEYELFRKTSDFVKDCDVEIIADHSIESIELTDVDKDTIGEISFIYSVGCIDGEGDVSTKLMLLSKGKKYAIRGTSIVCIDDNSIEYSEGEFTEGKELKNEPVLRRFMLKKWDLFFQENKEE